MIFSSRHLVAATVTCYGTYIKELADPDSEAWGKLLDQSAGPVLGIYGEEDSSPSPDDARKFSAALKENGLAHNVTIYPSVGHGFITPEAHKDSEAKDHDTTVDAWQEIETFLAGALDNNSMAERRRFSGGDKIPLAVNEAKAPHVVPFLMGLRHRLECAVKCASDHFTHTGHWHPGITAVGQAHALHHASADREQNAV